MSTESRLFVVALIVVGSHRCGGGTCGGGAVIETDFSPLAGKALTADRLRDVINYDPITGVFTWRARVSSTIYAGDPAGSLSSRGYLRITVDKIEYRANRLAWLYMHGSWPEFEVDHIDGDRANNRIVNLRDATRAINSQNQRRAQSHNKCGVLGVSAKRNRWEARITYGGIKRYIGTFETQELAHEAYLEAKRRFHPGCTI